MKNCMDSIPKNCNNCAFRKIMNKHWDLEDYCLLNKKHTSRIIIEEDCPLGEVEDNE